jgi:putative membrane protein
MWHPLLLAAPLAELQMSHFFANVLSALVFGIVGIFLMILGYKAFDWITPRLDVEKELSENHNIAVAIVIAAVIIGVSILIAHIVAA